MVYPKKAYFKDYVFMVDEHVYEPDEDTFLIAEKISVTEDDNVLEIGNGLWNFSCFGGKKSKKCRGC